MDGRAKYGIYSDVGLQTPENPSSSVKVASSITLSLTSTPVFKLHFFIFQFKFKFKFFHSFFIEN